MDDTLLKQKPFLELFSQPIKTLKVGYYFSRQFVSRLTNGTKPFGIILFNWVTWSPMLSTEKSKGFGRLK